MRRRSEAAGLLLIVFAGCSPAKYFDAQCEPACLSDAEIRTRSREILVRAPGAWRFFDDFARLLPPACGAADAGPTSAARLAWSHAVLTRVGANSTGNSKAARSSLDVRGGTAALSIDGVLWTWNAKTGEPLHGLESTRAGQQSESYPVAALTADGRRVWVNTVQDGPVLLDLHAGNEIDGPAVIASARASSSWAWPAPAVGEDDTLYWLSGDAVAHALGSDGHERWSKAEVYGRPFLGLDAGILWDVVPGYTAPLQMLRLGDGQESTWTSASLTDWTRAMVLTPENERLGARIVTLSVEPMSGDFWVRVHDRAGIARGEVPYQKDAGLDFRPEFAAVSDSKLFVVGGRGPGMQSTRVVALNADSLAAHWFLDVPFLDLPPVADRFGRLYMATPGCTILELSPEGAIAGTIPLQGKPSRTIMKLEDGMLFVVTEVPAAIPDGGIVPGSFTVTRPDGGISRVEDYECGELVPDACIERFMPGRTRVYLVSAYEVPTTAP